MAKVVKNFDKPEQKLVPMGKIPPGKLAVIVESPLDTYIGLIVIGSEGEGSQLLTISLDDGGMWDPCDNMCRILEKHETITLSNED